MWTVCAGRYVPMLTSGEPGDLSDRGQLVGEREFSVSDRLGHCGGQPAGAYLAQALSDGRNIGKAAWQRSTRRIVRLLLDPYFRARTRRAPGRSSGAISGRAA